MENIKVILVTGATGFIGNALVHHLSKDHSYDIRVSTRKKTSANFPKMVKVFVDLELSSHTNWGVVLKNVDCIIHCAAHAHIMGGGITKELENFKRINVDGTLNLARQAIQAHVKQFIFISSIGVNGDQAYQTPFKADDDPKPHSVYAQSKYEAEIELQKLAATTSLGVTIIRPPLVYAAHAPGNYSRLVKLIKLSILLPFGRIKNKRSFVFLGNLIDLIDKCIGNPNAKNQIFLVSDDQDVSTSEFIQKIAQSLRKRAMFIPSPVFLIKIVLKITGKYKLFQQLFGSLRVDIDKTKTRLNWRPPYTLLQAFEKMSCQNALNKNAAHRSSDQSESR